MFSNNIPITIGVIGHLDVTFSDEHRNVITKIFDDLNKKYPNSPLVLFSQLAQGADIEVAKVFLEWKKEKRKDFKLTIPLPYEKEEFVGSLNSSEKTDFEEVISKADKQFILENIDNLPKEELYRNGGKFVADSSIILIALYENEDNNKKGGTADIVRYKWKAHLKMI